MRTVAEDDNLVAERQQFPLGLNVWYVIQVAGVNDGDDIIIVIIIIIIRY